MQGGSEQELTHDRRSGVLRVVGTERARPARAQYRRLYRLVALTDALSIALALLIAYWVRFGVRVPASDFLAALLATPPVLLATLAGFRLYDAHRFTPAEEFRRLILGISLG